MKTEWPKHLKHHSGWEGVWHVPLRSKDNLGERPQDAWQPERVGSCVPIEVRGITAAGRGDPLRACRLLLLIRSTAPVCLEAGRPSLHWSILTKLHPYLSWHVLIANIHSYQVQSLSVSLVCSRTLELSRFHPSAMFEGQRPPSWRREATLQNWTWKTQVSFECWPFFCCIEFTFSLRWDFVTSSSFRYTITQHLSQRTVFTIKMSWM